MKFSIFRIRFLNSKTQAIGSPRGFTLIEMMVAVSIFAIVMLIGVGALLSLVQANARAEAINSVMNNLNAALDSMSRSIRVGTTYHCEISSAPPSPSTLAVPQDCGTSASPSASPGKLLAFAPATWDGNINNLTVYRLNGTQLERSLTSGQGVNGNFVAITAPEVSIDKFDFYVVGSSRGTVQSGGDGLQPRVLMRIQGSAKVPGGTTTFTVQASVVQRLLDI